jgi:hypothetical protein
LIARRLSLLITLCALGCNEIAGINEPIPKDGPGAAGTSTPTGGAKDPSRFVGTWSNGGGTLSLSCPQGPVSGTTTGKLQIAKGDTADLLVTDEDCTLKLSISGSTASLLPNQSCVYRLDVALVGDFRYASGTFTLDASGSRANVTLAGKVVVTNEDDGSQHPCDFQSNSPYTKD